MKRIRPGLKSTCLLMVAWMMATVGAWGCADPDTATKAGTASPHRLERIADAAAFEQLVASAGDRILMIEFFADWCSPCKVLEPVLVEVAAEVGDTADLYAVDVDANRQLARRMGVSGIPNVLVISAGKTVQRLRGVLPKTTYLEAIQRAWRRDTGM